MTISEIRVKALARCRTKGVSLCAMTAQTLKAAALLAMALTSMSIEATLVLALAMIIGGAGFYRAVTGAWRKGEAPFKSLFYYFSGLGRFCGALLISCMIAALLHVSMSLALDAAHAYSTGARVGCALGAAVCAYAAHVISLAYFAMELFPNDNILRTLGRTLEFVRSGFTQLIKLDATVLWWCAAVLAVTIGAVYAFGASAFAAILIIFAVYLSLCWLVSPYYRLAFAGLARDIMK